MRRLMADLAVVAALAAIFLVLFRNAPSRQAYFYDEADYIMAGSRGLAANILERPSMTVTTFLRTGLNRGMQTKRASLSDLVRGSRDITFYRHYHGPVYFYWLAALGPLVHFDEYSMRFSGLLFHVLTFAAIYFGVLLLASSRIAALLAACLFLFGQSNIGTATQITPHIPYVLFSITALLLFARYLQTGITAWWYGAVVAFAAAFCSIDYAILLPIVFAACFVLFPDRRLSLRVASRSVAGFALCLLVLWPVGLLQLSAIKGYFYIAYLAMQRKGSYGDDTPLTVWLSRLSASPLEYGMLALGLALVAVSLFQRRFRRYLTPLLFYALLMLLTTLKNTSPNPTYVSSILPALAVVAGVGIGLLLEETLPGFRVPAAALLLVLIVAGGYQIVLRNPAVPPQRPETGIMASLRQAGMEKSRVLVPYEYLPAMSYYFPQMQLHAYLNSDDPETLSGKLRDYRAQAIVIREIQLQSALARGFRVHADPVPASPGYSLVHIDGNL